MSKANYGTMLGTGMSGFAPMRWNPVLPNCSSFRRKISKTVILLPLTAFDSNKEKNREKIELYRRDS